jgi:cell division protein FtsB
MFFYYRHAVFFFLMTVSGYFVYHAFYGKRGIHALREKEALLSEIQQEYQFVFKDLERLKNKVKLMQDTIDPDILQQQAWILLRCVPQDQKVILCPP